MNSGFHLQAEAAFATYSHIRTQHVRLLSELSQ